MNKPDPKIIKDYLQSIPREFRMGENHLQIINHLRESLSSVQNLYLDGVKWFLYGGRATGRSYLSCIAAILFAIENPKMYVDVIDHHQKQSQLTSGHMFSTIEKIVSDCPYLNKDDFIYRLNPPTIMYAPKDQDEQK